ncbi:MAG: GTPase Era [Erysipelotrichaceae bacterium]|nr:GTPase Era [Erysipelotrichaceae bacterium]
MTFKSGFVGIIGKPNAGKSTLLNTIMKEKIAIATNKAQTTRNTIRAIKTTDDYQIIFVDTPGIHQAKHELGRQMNKQAFTTISGVDLVYYIIDGTKRFDDDDRKILRAIKNANVPIFLLVNKLDLLNESERYDSLLQWEKSKDFAEIIPISALKEKNIVELLAITLNYLKDGIMYYPTDQKIDYPESFLISEVIREKVLTYTNQEIPHSVAVIVEKLLFKNDVMIINTVIYVERESQKAIILGKNGSMIKRISSKAREELAFRFKSKIYLDIFVRVEKDWRNKVKQLKDLGYLQEKD